MSEINEEMLLNKKSVKNQNELLNEELYSKQVNV